MPAWGDKALREVYCVQSVSLMGAQQADGQWQSRILDRQNYYASALPTAPARFALPGRKSKAYYQQQK